MPFNILQWNINDLNRRLEFLQLLIKIQNPEILCLQETNFKKSLSTKLKNYSIIFKNRLNTNRASGWVAIYTKNDIYTKEVQLTTNLEAVATKILLQREICICNVYIPNNFNLQELQHLINQLLKPFILTGDFNSHYRPHFIPPWQIVLPKINLELQKLSKKNTEPILYRTKFWRT